MQPMGPVLAGFLCYTAGDIEVIASALRRKGIFNHRNSCDIGMEHNIWMRQLLSWLLCCLTNKTTPKPGGFWQQGFLGWSLFGTPTSLFYQHLGEAAPAEGGQGKPGRKGKPWFLTAQLSIHFKAQAHWSHAMRKSNIEKGAEPHRRAIQRREHHF